MSPFNVVSRPRSATFSLRSALALLAVLALVLAACGDDDTEASDPDTTTSVPDDGDDGDDGSGDDDDPPADDGNDGDDLAPVVDDDSGYEPTVAMEDMVDPQPHLIDEVVVSDDGMTLGVRYMSGAEPCSGGRTTVDEGDEIITVSLETGANPDAATMTCIAELIGYELAVPLDAPVGDRKVVLAD